MYRTQNPGSVVIICAAVSALIVSGACRRAEEAVPVTEVQSEHLQQTARPMTVAGCLKAGEAANTFVLSTTRAEGGGESATYELRPEPDLALQDHVGQQVQVSGMLEARQTAAAQTFQEPAETGNDQPAGTPGTPTVQTRTLVKINVLTVESLKPLGEECGIGM